MALSIKTNTGMEYFMGLPAWELAQVCKDLKELMEDGK